MAMHYAPPSFPFSKLFSLGVVMIVMGLITLALGVVDLVYTQIKYATDLCENPKFVDWECPNQPCGNPSIPFALAAPGVWAGFFTLVAGGISAALMYASGATIKTKRDSTGVLSGLVAFPLGPATLVISALRLYYMNTYFYCMDNGEFKIADYLEFLMPILIAMSMFMAWCLALVIMVALCRNGRLTLRDDFEYEYGRRYRRDEYPPRPYDSPRSRHRPYVVPDPYEQGYVDRPRGTHWRDRSQMAGWEAAPHWARPYGTGARSEPYPSYSRRYLDPYYPGRGYYTTKTYNRY